MNSSTEYKQPNERIIKLSDLFWRVIFSWRFLIISAIVFAIGVSGVKYINDCKQNETARQANNEVGIVDIEKQLAEEEKVVLLEANKLHEQITKQENYQQDSIWMNLDAYAENVVVLQYYVDTNYSFYIDEMISSDNTRDIVAAYISYIENNGVYSELEKQLRWDTEAHYIEELITAYSDVSIEKGMFKISVAGETPEKADELATVVDNQVMQYQANLVEKIGEHALILIDRYDSVTVDTALASDQEKLNASIKRQKQELNLLIAEFSANQLAVWNEINDTENETMDSGKAEIRQATISMKYITLGAFVGVFLGCVWIVCRYLLSNRLQSAEELQQMYELRSLGNIRIQTKRKTLLGRVDGWLQILRDKEQWSDEERRQLAVTNIKVICNKEQIQRIFFTSSIHMSEEDKLQINQMIEELKKYNIIAEYGENVARNASSLEKMAEIGHIIFVEKVGVSQYKEVEKEIGLCCSSEIDILGTVVL